MSDGTRKERRSPNRAKRVWYAAYRSQRFRRRFGWPASESDERSRHAQSRCAVRPGRRGDPDEEERPGDSSQG